MKHAVVWTETEDATIRARYPQEGGTLFMRGKTTEQMKARASVLGVRFARPTPFPIGTERGAWRVVGLPVRVPREGTKLPCECMQCGTKRLLRFCALRIGQTRQCRACAVRALKRRGYPAVARGFRAVRPSDARVQVPR